MEMDQNKPKMEMPTAFKAWFGFIGILGLAMLGGIVFAVYLLFAHFGVIG